MKCLSHLIEDQKTWNDLVSNQSGDFLQSWDWGDFQEKLGRSVKRIAILNQKNNALLCLVFLIKYPLPLKKNYLYIPRGPIIKNQEGVWNIFLNEIKRIANEEKSIFLKIEPITDDQKAALKILKELKFITTQTLQPQNTLIIDLLKNEEELLKEMEYETRYAIRVAKRRGVVIKKIENFLEKKEHLEEFWRLLQETAQRNHFKTYSKKYYEEILGLNGDLKSQLLLAYLDNQIIGANIIVFFNKTATYLYAASKKGYGKYNASTLLLWEAILEAKMKDYNFFDLWGISVSSKKSSDKWSGFTAFKKSFGGKEVNYLGTWDYIFDKKFYLLYKISRKIIG